MDIMEAVKFVAFYGLQSIVIALVGVVVFAGLYQLVRDRVHAFKARQRERRAATPTAVHETVKRS
jgi:hypothetical protein